MLRMIELLSIRDGSIVLLSICFFAPRDGSIVGQIVNLRPIGIRPAGSAHRFPRKPHI
jgi:hypothetical protein